jgi:peptidoglycan/xylan/chitin deacetylase (PgdA/CDA1 family)
MKYLSFRFDVDTHKCIREGVPNIIQLMNELNTKCTFFVNPGKSVSFIDSLKNVKGDRGNWGNKDSQRETIMQLSAYRKLGFWDYMIAASINPIISQSYKSQIRMIYDHGHEIGLHGGRNHELWHRYASNWNNAFILDEIEWGKEQLQKIIPELKINGFASPGWNSPRQLEKILKKTSFSYIADAHGKENSTAITKHLKNISFIHTAILGEPGGVGYIEHCRAKGMSDKAVIKDFEKRLSQQKRYAVIYDHPYFVGVRELDLLGKLMKVGKKMRYRIVPMRELLVKVSNV